MEPRGRGGRVEKASTPSPNPNPIPQPVTKAPKVPPVTATKKAKPKRLNLKHSAPPEKAAEKPKKAASTGAKPVKAPLVVANPPPEDISDLFDSLPYVACVQLTRRLLVCAADSAAGILLVPSQSVSSFPGSPKDRVPFR